MPELPDVCVYLEALERKVVGRVLDRIRLASPFVLRSYDPPLGATFGRTVQGVRRIGKRIVFELGEELFIVVHLMTRTTLASWTDILRAQAGEGFPEKVTAFREGIGGARPLRQAPAPCARRRCNASSMRKTNATTARAARRGASSSPTVRYPGC